ncbi:MAG TPA: hypothetical protein VME45_22765 [Stellaceae bacterium]|nr:hypothetical protein [Stellaceae bacterium]
MKQIAALAMGIILAGCVPPPPPPVVRPVALDPATLSECALIGREIAAQQRHAALGGIDATPLVQAAVQINAYNVINGLRDRAAIIGCG